jgi:ABC-2 type transport system ATP-binding protein
MIIVKHLTKRYGEYRAVDGVSFEIHAGEIFGFLGPNGAGKTSTLECMEGLRKPTSGFIQVAGINPWKEPRKMRNLIGVQLQSAGLPESMTPVDAMRIFCAYHDIYPRYELLEKMGLDEKKNTQFYELSGGQQRRLTLSLAIAHNPSVLFLDEPTAGLDVATRVKLHNLIGVLHDRGTTIILATHDMAEAEELSDRVAILMNGKIKKIGSLLEITATGAGLTKISVRTKNKSVFRNETTIPAVNHQTAKEDYKIFYSFDIKSTISAILVQIESHADTVIDLRVERPSLEDRFLEITNERSEILS